MFKLSVNKHTFLWLFTLSIVFVLTLPILIQDGMFMDGVLYTAVSHNLANGIGTFWFPSFSFNNLAGIKDSFHEQPPLVFGIQALFFKVLGSSMYVERLYVLVCLIIHILLIKKLWELVFKNTSSLQKYSWLPVLFWITIPVCFWSFTNNMHENTLSIFILLAIIHQIKGIQSINNTNHWKYFFYSAIFIFLASLSKGVPGLFPIVTPVIAFFIIKDISIKKVFLYILFLTLVVFGIYGLLLLNESARESLYNYFYLRLIKRINDVPTTTNYFYTLFRLVQETLILVGLVATLKLSFKNKIVKPIQITAYAKSFLVIGLIGVIPLMLTLVQKGFYMVPALPFIAMAFALLCLNEIVFIMEETRLPIPEIILKSFIVFLFLFSVLLPVANKNKFSRNKELLTDVYELGRLIPEHSVLNCSPDLIQDWSLQCYLSRYFFTSLDINASHTYILYNRNFYIESKVLLSEKYVEIPSKMTNYVLLKAKN